MQRGSRRVGMDAGVTSEESTRACACGFVWVCVCVLGKIL